MTLLNRVPAPEPEDIAAGGEWLEWMPGERFALRVPSGATQGRYTMLEVTAVTRCGPPLHIHRHEDEHFIILEGTVRFVRGDRVFDASAGTTVTVPKGVRHTWSAISDGAIRMLLVFTPGASTTASWNWPGRRRTRPRPSWPAMAAPWSARRSAAS